MTQLKSTMLEIEKQPLGSLDIKELQIAKLKEVFPEAFAEGDTIDWDKLKLVLGESIEIGKERFFFLRTVSIPKNTNCSPQMSPDEGGDFAPSRIREVCRL